MDAYSFIARFGPALLALVVAAIVLRLLLAAPGQAWRAWRRRRQRPLGAYPTHVLESAWRFDSALRDHAIQRGTVSRLEIERGIERGLLLVHAERRRRARCD